MCTRICESSRRDDCLCILDKISAAHSYASRSTITYILSLISRRTELRLAPPCYPPRARMCVGTLMRAYVCMCEYTCHSTSSSVASQVQPEQCPSSVFLHAPSSFSFILSLSLSIFILLRLSCGYVSSWHALPIFLTGLPAIAVARLHPRLAYSTP